MILNFESKVQSLEKLLPHLSPEKLNNMVNVIERASEIPENLGTVKSTLSVCIPGNCMVRVEGKTRVCLDNCDSKEIMFSPLIEFCGESDLIMYESTDVL